MQTSFNVFDSLREMSGASVILSTFPILKRESRLSVWLDLIEKKAIDANGKEILTDSQRPKKRSKSATFGRAQ